MLGSLRRRWWIDGRKQPLAPGSSCVWTEVYDGSYCGGGVVVFVWPLVW